MQILTLFHKLTILMECIQLTKATNVVNILHWKRLMLIFGSTPPPSSASQGRQPSTSYTENVKSLKTLQFCFDPLVSVNCQVILTPPYTITTRAVFSHSIPVPVLCCAVEVQAGLEKTRFFFLKPSPVGFFGFFAQTRGLLGFFSVSRILLGASRL